MKSDKEKEYHRKWMAEWRKNNHDKAIEINRKCWRKNADGYNEKRRLRYENDDEYRKKKVEAELKYKASGRRSECNKANPKHRQRSAAWKKKHPLRVKKYVRRYKDEVWINHEREQRTSLATPYVLKVIKKSMNYIVKTKDIPKDLIEIQRTKIFIQRKLKQII